MTVWGKGAGAGLVGATSAEGAKVGVLIMKSMSFSLAPKFFRSIMSAVLR